MNDMLPNAKNRPHLCMDCNRDISHRARNARRCESCLVAREKERRQKAYLDNRAARLQARRDAYWQDRTPVLLCVDCRADISDRPRNTRLCESCLAVRDKARKRNDYWDHHEEKLQSSRDYYWQNRTTVLERIKTQRQTPEHKETRQAWIAENPDKVEIYRQRNKQRHREKTGYNPEARPPCKKCGGAIEVDRGHRATWCRTCSEPRKCIVCGKYTGKGGPSKFCRDKSCKEKYHQSEILSTEPRRCTKCKRIKQRSEFGRHSGRLRSTCKSCEVKDGSERYYNFTPGQRASRNTLRREREEAKRAAMSPAEKALKTTRLRQAHRRKLYGPDFDENRWYSDQGGKCAICRTPRPLEDLEVDHEHVDHEHGVVRPGGVRQPRGLLCKSCNFGFLPRYEKFFPRQHQDSPLLNAYLSKGKHQ